MYQCRKRWAADPMETQELSALVTLFGTWGLLGRISTWAKFEITSEASGKGSVRLGVSPSTWPADHRRKLSIVLGGVHYGSGVCCVWFRPNEVGGPANGVGIMNSIPSGTE